MQSATREIQFGLPYPLLTTSSEEPLRGDWSYGFTPYHEAKYYLCILGDSKVTGPISIASVHLKQVQVAGSRLYQASIAKKHLLQRPDNTSAVGAFMPWKSASLKYTASPVLVPDRYRKEIAKALSNPDPQSYRLLLACAFTKEMDIRWPNSDGSHRARQHFTCKPGDLYPLRVLEQDALKHLQYFGDTNVRSLMADSKKK